MMKLWYDVGKIIDKEIKEVEKYNKLSYFNS